MTTEKSLEMNVSGPEPKVNYSAALLARDARNRAHILRELERIKDEYEISGCRVLEAGCGLGRNLEIFREDNVVSGIDGLPDAVKQARMRGLDVIEANLELGLQAKSASVDWVFCLDVLEHLVDPLRLLEESYRILRDKGHIVINVPNHFNAAGRIKILLGHDLDVHRFFPEKQEWNNPHLRFFTYRGIQQMLMNTGFETVEDRSARFPSVPGQAVLERIGLRRLSCFLSFCRPSFFAGGFFLIAEKRPLSRRVLLTIKR